MQNLNKFHVSLLYLKLWINLSPSTCLVRSFLPSVMVANTKLDALVLCLFCIVIKMLPYCSLVNLQSQGFTSLSNGWNRCRKTMSALRTIPSHATEPDVVIGREFQPTDARAAKPRHHEPAGTAVVHGAGKMQYNKQPTINSTSSAADEPTRYC